MRVLFKALEGTFCYVIGSEGATFTKLDHGVSDGAY